MEEKENKITPDLIHEIYKKTLGYSLDRIVINDDGTTSHIHSDEFLEKHPERVSSPEFTKEEEIEEVKFMYGMVINLENTLMKLS